MSSGQEVGDIFGQDAGYGPSTSLLRSPTVLISSIGLWGMNILLFRHFGIDHVRVLSGVLTSSEDAHGGSSGSSLTNGDSTTLSSNGTKSSSSSSTTTTADQGVTALKCFALSLALLAHLNMTTYVYIHTVPGGTAVGALFLFYVTVAVAAATPCRSNKWIRDALGVVCYRAAELLRPRCQCVAELDASSSSSSRAARSPPPRPIPFVDVFFADAMCSLSKVFFDWGMLWHLASHYPDPVPVSVHSIVIPSAFAALPYLVRARQCVVMYYVGKFSDDPKRYQHTLNAIKYSTSLFPICLSAYQKVIGDYEAAALEKYLVILLIINSLYSYAWDILMDWGMMQNPTAALTMPCAPKMTTVNGSIRPTHNQSCTGLLLRSRLRFGVPISSVILIADGVFRFGWILRFYHESFFETVDEYILFTELLEVFRRAIWNLLRVEWENIKQSKAEGKSHDDDDEEEPFVPSSGSSVQMAPISAVMRPSNLNSVTSNSSLES